MFRKRKIISSTYLRDVTKYQIKLFLDEDELLDGFQKGNITKEELDMIYSVKDKLIGEIKSKCNKYMNIDYSKYINF